MLMTEPAPAPETAELFEGIASVAKGIANLQQHVLRAGATGGRAMSEIDERSRLLDAALKAAEERARESTLAADMPCPTPP